VSALTGTVISGSSPGRLTREPGRSEAERLGRLYARNKALALAVGASLALRKRPAGCLAEVREHLADCETAAAAAGPLASHLGACRDAAADLAALVAEVERDLRTPSREPIAAARASHRRLRRLVWEVFDCEYAPCGHEKSH
jgi:hypothetical protein